MYFPREQAVAVVSAVVYGFMSLSMAFLNKAVVSGYEFNFPFFILLCQMTLTLCMLECMRMSGKFDLPNITLSSVKMFALPSFCYSLHATVSLMALEGMNIPMYGAVKRCGAFMNLVLAVTYLKKPMPSRQLIASVVIITVGCLIAGFSDPTFNGFAYMMGALSVLSQAMYLTLVQQCGEKNMSPLQVLHLNSAISVIPFLLLTYIFGEMKAVSNHQRMTEPEFFIVLVTLIVMGLLLNFSLFWCTISNSALTTSIVGVAKSVLQTVIGFFTFGGLTLHVVNVIGIILNTTGSVLYSYTKYKEGERSRRNVDLGDTGIQKTGWELKAKLEPPK